jgi:beta-glucosidase
VVQGGVEASFPSDFLWGTATAPHQVEGNNTDADWWDWEQAGRCRGGQRSGLACDQYRRFREDFALLAQLNQRAHRLGVEWARVEPRPGDFEPAELAHYRTVLATLRQLGIEPVVTLHHFTNPRWLARAGGWDSPAVVGLFERYTARVVDELSDLVRYWVTINEPNVFASYGYALGLWPPGRRDPLAAFRVVANMVRAHGHAYQAIHRRRPDALVGVAHHWRPFEPLRSRSPDRLAAALRNALFNRAFPRALTDGVLRFPLGRGQSVPEARGSQDFFGLNYYTRERVSFALARPHELFGREVRPVVARDTTGSELHPAGFERALRDVAGYGRPVLVTENGVADRDDELRPAFLVDHLLALHRAMRAGVPVIGYLHWSSVDNFEWLDGFDQRFGLIRVDFRTQERSPKPSARLYAEICRTGTITREQVRALPAAPRPAGVPPGAGP